MCTGWLMERLLCSVLGELDIKGQAPVINEVIELRRRHVCTKLLPWQYSFPWIHFQAILLLRLQWFE